VPAVRQAALKKYQELVVLVPVKSSVTELCACARRSGAIAMRATTPTREVHFLRFITSHLC
jgi:hypothetical protein